LAKARLKRPDHLKPASYTSNLWEKQRIQGGVVNAEAAFSGEGWTQIAISSELTGEPFGAKSYHVWLIICNVVSSAHLLRILE